ncbi:MAG: cupin domain-containing protein [Gammaproteobacteria bacterium]|nr:cupin domain-containing protein [Gammaproteobacteria bacterium]
MNKQTIISNLSLKPHPSEGGYFKRTYTSEINTSCTAGERATLSSIYYMLTDDSPVGYLHKNKSDIIHYFHSGSAINYIIIHPDGRLEEKTLGNDLTLDQTPQLTVKGGCWKTCVLNTGEYGLLSEAVSPGFEYEDMELASTALITQHFPELLDTIKPYICPG